MKKTPWVLLGLNAAVLSALAALAWLGRVELNEVAPYLRPIAGPIKNHVGTWIFGVTIGGIILQLIERSIIVHQARKRTVQKLLDQVVKNLLDNDPRNNRCTLFRAVHGWRAFIHCAFRLPWQEEKLLVIRDLARLARHPFGKFLYVYVRATRSNNDRSCAVWRVYENKPNGCEGVAGMVWSNDYLALSLRRVPKEADVERLDASKPLDKYSRNSIIRAYAEGSGISNIHQLRSRTRIARHYVGSIVDTQDSSSRWGVLLVDSLHRDCPFPLPRAGAAPTPEELQFKDRFQGYALTLSIILT